MQLIENINTADQKFIILFKQVDTILVVSDELELCAEIIQLIACNSFWKDDIYRGLFLQHGRPDSKFSDDTLRDMLLSLLC